MRAQLQKLMTVRTLRMKQRRRDYQAEREKLETLKDSLAETSQRAGEIEAARAAVGRFASAHGDVFTHAAVTDAQRQRQFYDMQLRELRSTKIRLDRQIRQQEQSVAEAFETLRAAERATEQLQTFDAELAEKEARDAEMQEELQTETPPKPRWKQ